MRWDEAPIVSGAQTGEVGAKPLPKESWQSAPIVEPPSTLDKVGRQVGLFARSAVTGAASIPAIGADALGAILNLGIEAYNKKTGSSVPKFEPQMQKLEQNLSAAGLPAPETAAEKIVYRTNQALSGQAGAIGAGRVLANSSNPVASGAGKTMSTRPDVQLQAAGGAGAAGGAAHEAGWSPLSEFIASLTGGVALPVGVALTRGVPGLVQPFTQKGQREIAGNVLSDSASSPADAKAALANAQSDVPGVQPTIGAATRDPGLASLERSLSAKPAGGILQDRYLQNNAARVSELDDLAGTQGMIRSAESARDSATSAAREAAFASSKIGSPSSAVVANIDATLKSPKGKRENVAAALNWVKQRLQGVTDPAELYAVRQDIGEAMNGKLAGDKSSFKLASGELRDVQRMLDDVIETDAPGFKAYLQSYKDQSKPINQMEILQELRSRVLGTQEDRAGNRQLLASSMQRSMGDLDSIAATATGFKKAEAEKILTPKQMQRLEALRKDVSDAAFSQSGGKVAGSNTVQLANYSTANVIGRIVSGRGDAGPITRNLARSLDWANKLNDQDIDRLLIEAAKDPALAGTLMKGATKDRLELASDELERLARAIGIGVATSQAKQKEKTAK